MIICSGFYGNDRKCLIFKMCACTEILSHAHSAVAECDQWTGEAECREGKVYGSFPLVLAWGRVFLGGGG